MKKELSHLATDNMEKFRINVVASDAELLNQYKQVLALQLEAERKAYEYQLRDMDKKEAESLMKMSGDKKKSSNFFDSMM